MTLSYLLHSLPPSRGILYFAIFMNVLMYVSLLVLFILEFAFFPNPPESQPQLINVADFLIERMTHYSVLLSSSFFLRPALHLSLCCEWLC